VDLKRIELENDNANLLSFLIVLALSNKDVEVDPMLMLEIRRVCVECSWTTHDSDGVRPTCTPFPTTDKARAEAVLCRGRLRRR
jgi:hypothetical protein